MDPMATTPATPPAPRRTLRRDPAHGYIGGVCAGLARETGIDPLAVRVGFVAAALAGGFGLPIHLLARAPLPPGSPRGVALQPPPPPRPPANQVGLGVGLLLLSVLLAFR